MKKTNKILLFLGLGIGVIVYFSVFYKYSKVAWTHRCEQIKWYTTSEEHLVLVANSIELEEDWFNDEGQVDFLAINKRTGNLDRYIRNVAEVPILTRTPEIPVREEFWVDPDNPYILYCRTANTLKKVNLYTEKNDWELDIPIEIVVVDDIKTIKLLGKKGSLLYFILLIEKENYYEFIKKISDEFYDSKKDEIYKKYKIEDLVDHLIIEVNENTNEIRLLKSLPTIELQNNFVNLADKPLKSPLDTALLLQEDLELQIIGDSLCAKYK